MPQRMAEHEGRSGREHVQGLGVPERASGQECLGSDPDPGEVCSPLGHVAEVAGTVVRFDRDALLLAVQEGEASLPSDLKRDQQVTDVI